MATPQTLNIDSLLSDPFVSKLHLIRDIGKSGLDALFSACRQSFGERILKQLLTTLCVAQLQSISNIDEDMISSSLRKSLTRHHEKYNPLNPALLHILPAAVLSKCFSYLNIDNLLCSVELVSRDWFHIARLASSISQFPASASIPSKQQAFKLKRLRNATTLYYNSSSATSGEPINLLNNIDALPHINRVCADGVLPLFITKCPVSFVQQIQKLEIDHAWPGIEATFWDSLVDKCRDLRVLKLRNLLISKTSHPSLIKFISCCKHLTEFECHRWRFAHENMRINGTIKALSEHCRSLNSLRIEYCRMNDKIVTSITKLMEYKLRSLALINCHSLKSSTFTTFAQKQEQLYTKTHSKKRLYAFAIDDKMISGSILDHFVGLKSLSIASDHLSGSISYSVLNRYKSLRDVSIQFRSSIDRLSSHSSSQFEWKLFFKEIGKTLVNFECNCAVIRDRKATDISNLKLLNKNDYQNFMILDANVFHFIAAFCKQLKTLKMSGWKFDTNAIKSAQNNDKLESENNKKRVAGRSQSMWFLSNKQARNRKHMNKASKMIPKAQALSNRAVNYKVKYNGAATKKASRDDSHAISSKADNESVADVSAGTVMENMMMIPMSNLLQPQQHKIYNKANGENVCLDYMKLEWMFDSDAMPSLNSLNFWCDTVLGLKCTMSMNEELETGSVVILEWNQNWTLRYMTPNIICHNKLKENKPKAKNRNKTKNTKTKTK